MGNRVFELDQKGLVPERYEYLEFACNLSFPIEEASSLSLKDLNTTLSHPVAVHR